MPNSNGNNDNNNYYSLGDLKKSSFVREQSYIRKIHEYIITKKTTAKTTLLKKFIQNDCHIQTNNSYRLTELMSDFKKITEATERVSRMLNINVFALVVCWTPSFIWWIIVLIFDLFQSYTFQTCKLSLQTKLSTKIVKLARSMTQDNNDGLLYSGSHIEQ
ncbi:unnamed protein product [Thelazia callipaeda]|uniref:G_PROTEIN_RECEP_F1_2 domain-containing protein n=1 Tax=Thelazia callipaeda TaxID=103827 RepID=A0A0N5CUA5_THECL|nr:unnamed protein product [Thelazia callipaeda]